LVVFVINYQKFVTIHNNDREITKRVNDSVSHCDWQRIIIIINVFGTGITLPGPSEVSQAAAGPCWLQLCTVVRGSSNKKLVTITSFGGAFDHHV